MINEYILNENVIFLDIEKCLWASSEGDGSWWQNPIHDLIGNIQHKN
jgi:hypothetical protein